MSWREVSLSLLSEINLYLHFRGTGDRVCCFEALGVSFPAGSLASERIEQGARAAAKAKVEADISREEYILLLGVRPGPLGEHWKISRGSFRP